MHTPEAPATAQAVHTHTHVQAKTHAHVKMQTATLLSAAAHVRMWTFAFRRCAMSCPPSLYKYKHVDCVQDRRRPSSGPAFRPLIIVCVRRAEMSSMEATIGSIEQGVELLLLPRCSLRVPPDTRNCIRPTRTVAEHTAGGRLGLRRTQRLNYNCCPEGSNTSINGPHQQRYATSFFNV